MIGHIVVFKFKEEEKQSNLLRAKTMLEELVELIEPLRFMEVGVNFDESERAFDLSVYAKFDSKEDLQAYAIHPAHLKVVAFIKQVAVESKVVDYLL